MTFKLSSSQEELETIIKISLGEFIKGINANKWVGRENEAVNVFVFSYLLKRVKEGSILFDPGQIGIEVAVPQINSNKEKNKNKEQVRKDLVIWEKPFRTCFNKDKKPENYPIAILEWKFKGFREKQKDRDKQFEEDIIWLKEFTRNRNILGYAIMIDYFEGIHRIKASRILKGEEEKFITRK